MQLFDQDALAVVTGGSRGIGRGVVEALVDEGVRVVFTYRSDETAAKQLVVDLQDRADVEALQLDVSDEAQVRSVFRHVRKTYGSMDVLVNNAGVHDDGLAAAMSLKKFDDVVQTNLYGSFLCAREALRLMAQSRRGSIVNVSSAVAVRGGRGQANYSASKAGLLGLTQSLALEACAYGIRVNAVSPGFVATDMLRGLPMAEIAETIPLGRVATPAEIGAVVAFVASDRASYLTGINLIADGGIVVH